MALNLLENVKVYLLSHAVTTTWYILAIRRKLEYVFRIIHVLKNLMLKFWKFYF